MVGESPEMNFFATRKIFPKFAMVEVVSWFFEAKSARRIIPNISMEMRVLAVWNLSLLLPKMRAGEQKPMKHMRNFSVMLVASIKS